MDGIRYWEVIAPMLPLLQKVIWRAVLQTRRLGLLLYGAVGIYGYFFTNRQLFPVPPVGYDAEEPNLITLNPEPGITLRAVHKTHPEAPYTLLYSHGNGTDLGYMRASINHWHRMGLNVLAYDYRGYGLSTGMPSEQGVYQDVEAAYQYLRDQGVPGDRIIPYGFSLGGGPSTYIAATQPVAGLILEATFTSVFRIINRVPLYPFDKFPNLERLKTIQVPLLILHGTDDPVIPFSHGQQLAQIHPQRTQFVAIPGGGHGNLSLVAAEQRQQALSEFIQRLEPER